MKPENKQRTLALIRKVSPRAANQAKELQQLRRMPQDVRRRLRALSRRVDELEREMQEQRRLQRRLAELTDLVEELLVPAVDRDEQRLQALLRADAEGRRSTQ